LARSSASASRRRRRRIRVFGHPDALADLGDALVDPFQLANALIDRDRLGVGVDRDVMLAPLAQRAVEHLGDPARQRVARLGDELREPRREAVDELVELHPEQLRHAVDRERRLLFCLVLDLLADAPAQDERQHRRRRGE
jgi:hypothetical protein